MKHFVERLIQISSDFDYQPLQSDLTFTPTVNTVCRYINTTDDSFSEYNETISLFLTSDDSAVVLVPEATTGEITILDDDGNLNNYVSIKQSWRSTLFCHRNFHWIRKCQYCCQKTIQYCWGVCRSERGATDENSESYSIHRGLYCNRYAVNIKTGL